QNIEYITPDQMTEGDSAVVEAIVKEKMQINLLKRLDNSTYKKLSSISGVDIQGFMLSGNNFIIKKLEGKKLGRWSWEVIATESGVSSLTLSTNLSIDSKNGEQTVNIPIFLKAVDIESKPVYHISNFMSKGMYVVFAILLALGIFTMISKNNKSKNVKRDG
ncbi:MAG: hypothetical protein GTN99_06275, partial [Candidatus Dadabacteria bacterium]|nr:hypothetical protein [Candidatus Dadabacteria bacterium]